MSAARDFDTPTVAEDSALVGAQLVERGQFLLQLGRDLLRQSDLLRGQAPAEERPIREVAAEEHSLGKSGQLIDLQAARACARRLGVFSRIKFEDALGLTGAATTKWIRELMQAGDISRGTDEESGDLVYRYSRPIEEEPPTLQVQAFAQQIGERFSAEQATEGTGLTDEEITVALAELVAKGVLSAERVKAVHDIKDAGQLDQTVYRYIPELAGGQQTRLEQRRLAAVADAATVEVPRGTPVRIRTERQQGRARSTPGQRQKVINQDREWQRLQDAQAQRAEKNRERAAKERERAARSGKKAKLARKSKPA